MGTLERVERETEKLREEFLYYVLQWDPKWFTKENESTIQLNSIMLLKLKPLTLFYNNYDDYYQAQLSSLLYDFWYRLNDISLRNHKCEKVSDITLSKTPLLLECISVNSKNDKVYRITMRARILYGMKLHYASRGYLVKFKNPLNENTEQLACVESVLYEKLHGKRKFQLTYGLIIKYQENSEIPNTIVLESVTPSLSVYLSYVDSLINISKSPLCEAILSPSIKEYEFSSISDDDKIEPFVEEKLNSKQLDIIARTVKTVEDEKPGIFMISGAAGTGKSKIIVESILSMLIRKSTDKILVCGQSNGAIDSIVLQLLDAKEKLLQKGTKLNIIRIGREDKINERAKAVSFNELKKICGGTRDRRYRYFR
ncbi:probable helicase senataxin isoform X2 [Microplitis mediator]|uniref:probable helicase senataxin isoform X1 n=1 Tax=Microplitis mediator TaxID=375433 RepID=UPI0025521539|nr:probable helicase senataxin isoform X1 [Microplitis mediator]XP_057330197.1 probable helicase senataxin isoform X2 [Microplitis mediator]